MWYNFDARFTYPGEIFKRIDKDLIYGVYPDPSTFLVNNAKDF